MADDALLDAVPDLVVLLRRDGLVLAHGGGDACGELKPAAPAAGKRAGQLWSAAVAQLLKRLAGRAIAMRGACEAKFQECGRGFEARASARGPDRALCVIRPVLTAASPDTLEATGELPRPQLDRRGFLRRFQDAMSIAALSETPTAIAVIQVDGLSDIAQVMDSRIAEQLMSHAILRLPAPAGGSGSGNRGVEGVDASRWFMGQLSDSLLALVLTTADRDAIDACVAALCASLREPIRLNDGEFHLTPYAGVAILGRDASSPRQLLEHARAAATYARRAGSGKVCFFSDTLRLRSLARLDITRELSEAIANRDIRLRYVGRHDLASGRLVAWVGYLRWMHPIRGEIRPAEFLRVAETTGLATALSRTLLRCLQEDFSALAPQSDADVRISFGALRHHMLHEDFVADIERMLAASVVPAARLELRIAEKTFIACDPATFQKLARLGVQLVVDEVGRGLGSLDALARAPIWGLQLDRAWVTGLRSDAVALKACRAGIVVAGALGLTPIAVGVDDPAQRQALLALGCRYGCGDLYRDDAPDITLPHRVAASD
jgi:predicted signal transduction protein with EAL and GGDEF domain